MEYGDGGGNVGVQRKREIASVGNVCMAWWRRNGNISGKAHAGVEMHCM